MGSLMSTLLKCYHTFGDSGDAQGDHSEYFVEFAETAATSIEARSAVGITFGIIEGSVMFGTNWRARLKADRNADAPTQWKVTVDFASANLNEQRPPGSGVCWNVAVEVRPIPYQRPAYTDRAGKCIVNSAGDAFQQQPQYIAHDSAITVNFNTDYGDLVNLLRAKVGLVNSDTVSFSYKGTALAFDPGTLRLVDYQWGFDHNYASDSTEETFKVSIVMAERQDGWHDIQIENSGFYDIDGKRISDQDINPSAPKDDDRVEASLLGSNGYPLTDTSTASPLNFDIKDPVTFSDLFEGL